MSFLIIVDACMMVVMVVHRSPYVTGSNEHGYWTLTKHKVNSVSITVIIKDGLNHCSKNVRRQEPCTETNNHTYLLFSYWGGPSYRLISSHPNKNSSIDSVLKVRTTKYLIHWDTSLLRFWRFHVLHNKDFTDSTYSRTTFVLRSRTNGSFIIDHTRVPLGPCFPQQEMCSNRGSGT